MEPAVHRSRSIASTPVLILGWQFGNLCSVQNWTRENAPKAGSTGRLSAALAAARAAPRRAQRVMIGSRKEVWGRPNRAAKPPSKMIAGAGIEIAETGRIRESIGQYGGRFRGRLYTPRGNRMLRRVETQGGALCRGASSF